MLISVAEYTRLQTQTSITAPPDRQLSPDRWRCQEALLAQAHSLRARFAPPEQRLAELFTDLPPAEDEFWLEVIEAN